MYEFGVGALFAKMSDGTSVEFGTLQNTSLDISFDKKELYGRKSFPVKVARGKGKVDGKAEHADIKAAALNAILGGTITTGQLQVAEPVNGVIPADNYTLALPTVPNSGIFNQMLTMYDVSGKTKKPMTLVTSTPTESGQYKVSATASVAGARTYTVTANFAANDTITIGGVKFTAVASSAASGEFLVGSDIATSIVNLVAVMKASTAISSIYTVTYTSTTITLTETTAGGGHTPAAAVVTGTGKVSSGTATASVSPTRSFEYYSGDAGKTVQFQYDYNVTSGKTITITNNMMGTAPTFETELYTTLDGVPIVLCLNACTTDKLSLNMKNEDFLIPNFSWSAFADAADIVGHIYLNE